MRSDELRLENFERRAGGDRLAIPEPAVRPATGSPSTGVTRFARHCRAIPAASGQSPNTATAAQEAAKADLTGTRCIRRSVRGGRPGRWRIHRKQCDAGRGKGGTPLARAARAWHEEAAPAPCQKEPGLLFEQRAMPLVPAAVARDAAGPLQEYSARKARPRSASAGRRSP